MRQSLLSGLPRDLSAIKRTFHGEATAAGRSVHVHGLQAVRSWTQTTRPFLMKYHIEETMRPVFPSTKAQDPTYNAKITTAGSKDPSVSMTRMFSPPPMTTRAVAIATVRWMLFSV